jgi:hypothetical protein
MSMQTPNVIPMSIETPPPLDGAERPQKGEGRKKRNSSINMGNFITLMEGFALIYGTKTAWDEKYRRIVPIDALRLAMTSDAVKAWLNAPTRRMILPEQLVFEPGQTFDDGRINMFDGLETVPVKATDKDVAPMLELLRHLCSGPDVLADEADEIMHWVLRWIALPLQQLGTKMQTAIVMHGPQGTGKNLFWDLWRDLYGIYGVTVSQTELEDKYNDWLSCKMAIIGDEVVSRQEMYHNKNRLKLIVTQGSKFPIRGMHQSTRWESNHANVVFLSNESQPLALEERDRRYMVIYTPVAADAALYERVKKFLDGGGRAKWLYFLQNYPLDGFTAHTKPLMTEAKKALVTAGYRPAQRFAAEWLGGFLPLPLQVCSAEQLYRVFKRWGDLTGERFMPPQEIFGRELSRYAAESVRAGESPPLKVKPINLRTQTGRKTIRCWIPGLVQPPDGISEAEWAAACVDSFEPQIGAFLRASRPSADGLDSA